MSCRVFEHSPQKGVLRPVPGTQASLCLAAGMATRITIGDAYVVDDWRGEWVACSVSRRQVPDMTLSELCWLFPVDVAASIKAEYWVIEDGYSPMDNSVLLRRNLIRRGARLIRGICTNMADAQA